MEPDIRECIFTQNKCYTESQPMTPCGIMVHDTGAGNPYLKRYLAPDDGIVGENQYHNHWNQYLESNNKCVHAFIGKGMDEKVYTYQSLDWTLKAHHSGRHPVTHKRAWDMGYIGFEMCDDKYVHEDYFNEVYEHAVSLCTFLCKTFGLKSTDIISHKEGHEMRIASNHADPHAWFDKFGKSMDTLRQEVAERLGETVEFQKIKQGCRDESLVKKIQKKLIELGYGEYLGNSGPGRDGVDGDYGDKTKEAVKAYQLSEGLKASSYDLGTVIESTYNLMFPDESTNATDPDIAKLDEGTYNNDEVKQKLIEFKSILLASINEDMTKKLNDFLDNL